MARALGLEPRWTFVDGFGDRCNRRYATPPYKCAIFFMRIPSHWVSRLIPRAGAVSCRTPDKDAIFAYGGRSGIRTHGRLPFTTFPRWRHRPLGHSSILLFSTYPRLLTTIRALSLSIITNSKWIALKNKPVHLSFPNPLPVAIFPFMSALRAF